MRRKFAVTQPEISTVSFQTNAEHLPLQSGLLRVEMGAQ